MKGCVVKIMQILVSFLALVCETAFATGLARKTARGGLVCRRVVVALISTIGAALMLAAPAAAQSTLTVTTMADVTHATPDCSSGTGNTCSLRDAIGVANKDNNGDTIQFLPKGVSVTPFVGNLELTQGTLVISAGMTIQGPGANLLTISGWTARQILYQWF
jgi:hypothetical protein